MRRWAPELSIDLPEAEPLSDRELVVQLSHKLQHTLVVGDRSEELPTAEVNIADVGQTHLVIPQRIVSTKIEAVNSSSSGALSTLLPKCIRQVPISPWMIAQ